MSPDKGPVTKADLNDAIQGIKTLIQNELKHQAEDIADLKDWRKQFFMTEEGPWRLMDKRVNAVEYLARNIRWVIAALSPIAVWAAIEMIKAAVVWLQSGP